MAKQPKVIRNKKGAVIGKIHQEGSFLVARNKKGNVVGKYDPKTNRTLDRNGRVFEKGNTLEALIED